MANVSGCPPPFLDEADFPSSGGYINGRSCGPSPLDKGVSCCLPCPIEEWVYPESYLTLIRNINYLSILSFVLCCFVLVSYLVLPPSKSHRHYLNVGLLSIFIPFHIALFIPLADQPSTCYNAITPRDVYSSASCAVSGSFLAIGGIGVVIWIFLRTLWTHVRVCWDFDPGRVFMYASIISGIVLPAAFLTAILVASGLSFRLGKTCVPNYKNSFATFWGWMLAFVGLSCLMQLVTTGYGIWTFLKSAKGDGRRHGNSTISAVGNSATTRTRFSSLSAGKGDSVGVEESNLSTANTPITTRAQSIWASAATSNQTARQTAWKEVRSLLSMQWRSITISFMIMIEITFFTAVFIAQDQKTAGSGDQLNQVSGVQQWSTCLVLTGGDRDICRPFTKAIVLPQSVVLAALILIALTGSEVAVLLIRRDTLVAWRDLLRRLFRRERRDHHSSDLPLTSLAAHSSLNRTSDTVDEKIGPTSAVATASPTWTSSSIQPQSIFSPLSGNAQVRVFTPHKLETSTGVSARTSRFRPWSWRRSTTPPQTPNWPLPLAGLPSVPQAGNEPTIKKTTTPLWLREEEEEDGKVVLDRRAWGRGGLAMNPVAPPAVPGKDVTMDAGEPSHHSSNESGRSGRSNASHEVSEEGPSHLKIPPQPGAERGRVESAFGKDSTTTISMSSSRESGVSVVRGEKVGSGRSENGV